MPHPSCLCLQSTVSLEGTLGQSLTVRRVVKTLLSAGASAIHPYAWLASCSSARLPDTKQLLLSAERRLLLAQLALSLPSGEGLGRPERLCNACTGIASHVKQLDFQDSMCNRLV